MFGRPIFISLSLLIVYIFNLAGKIDVSQVDKLELMQSLTIYDSKNKYITHCGNLQIKLDYKDIPQHCINALLATEDVHFWSHFGLNVPALGKAVVENFTSRKVVRGGSTITQQLAKNILFSNDSTLMAKKTKRKVVEMALALKLEKELTKEKILEYYMNRIYFGRGAYGIAAAAKLYFGKNVAQLSTEEVAFLIGLVRAPSMYARNHDKALDRALHVLGRMQKVGFIEKKYTKKEIDSAIKPIAHYADLHINCFIDWVKTSIPKTVSDKEPLHIYTTLNSALTRKTAKLLPKIKKNSRFEFSQIAFIACEPDGAVSVMIGGFEDLPNSFNRAVQAYRQAGSIFKIYTFMCAFLQGMRLKDTVDDCPPTIGGWTPSNYMHNEVGFVTLERAFSESINGATVRIAMDCGLNNIINLCRVFGLNGTIPNDCSLILGSASMSLYQLAQTLLIISNNGLQKYPYCIREIRNSEKEILWSNIEDSPAITIISDKDALAEMKKALYSVVEKGTGRYANNNRYPIGGKTGTTQDYRDVWFGCISPFLIACAWCGHDDNTSMFKNKKGNNPAVAICKEVIEIESAEYEPEPEATK